MKSKPNEMWKMREFRLFIAVIVGVIAFTFVGVSVLLTETTPAFAFMLTISTTTSLGALVGWSSTIFEVIALKHKADKVDINKVMGKINQVIDITDEVLQNVDLKKLTEMLKNFQILMNPKAGDSHG